MADLLGFKDKCDRVSEPLTKEEFCRRFVDLMIRRVGDTFDDGTSAAASTREYAEMTAPTYWEEQHQEGESVQDCVDTDISYWSE